MNQDNKDFEAVLNEEERVLDDLLVNQQLFRKAVLSKDWEKLNIQVNKINSLTEEFQQVDAERTVIQEMLKVNEITPFFEKINTLRTKLLKFKVENDSLNKYVNITKDFVQEIVDNALPQSTAKVYSRNGMVKRQPQSVVLNQIV